MFQKINSTILISKYQVFPSDLITNRKSTTLACLKYNRFENTSVKPCTIETNRLIRHCKLIRHQSRQIN